MNQRITAAGLVSAMLVAALMEPSGAQQQPAPPGTQSTPAPQATPAAQSTPAAQPSSPGGSAPSSQSSAPPAPSSSAAGQSSGQSQPTQQQQPGQMPQQQPGQTQQQPGQTQQQPGQTQQQPGQTQQQPGQTQQQPGQTQRQQPGQTQQQPGQTPTGLQQQTGGSSPGSGASSRGQTGGGGGANGLPPPPEPAVLPIVPNVAPGYTAPRSLQPPAGDLVGVNQTPFVGIKLEDAVTMALQRNTDLAIAQSNSLIANYQIVAAQGAYDIRYQLSPTYQHNVQAPVSVFQSGPNGGPITQDTVGLSTGFRALTSSGGNVSLTGSAQRVTTNSTADSFSPQYFTSIGLSFTQPLFRGVGIDDTRRQILLARANADLQTNQELVNVSQTIANVSNTYWDLVAAWRNVAIQEEGLRTAQAQAASNRRLAQRGAAAPVDIIESNTQVNVFQDNVLSALLQVQRLQTQLKMLILSNPADPTWTANLVPTSNVGELPAEPKLDDLIVSALVHRPEIAELRSQRRTVDTNLQYARDQLKPDIALNGSVTTNGFAGQPTNPGNNPLFAAFGPQVTALNSLITRANAASPGMPPIPAVSISLPASPSYLVGKFGQSFSNLFENRFPVYSVTATLSLPIRNRTAKAEYAIAQEQGKQLQVQELALLQRVRAESVNAIQSLRETQYRLVAARAARDAAERVAASEQRRFAAGTSTTFLVLQRQLDVANERGRELQAQTDLNKAVVELNRVGGTIFISANFDVTALGGQTLNATSPTTSALPAPAATAPPPRRR